MKAKKLLNMLESLKFDEAYAILDGDDKWMMSSVDTPIWFRDKKMADKTAKNNNRFTHVVKVKLKRNPAAYNGYSILHVIED